MGQSSAGRTSAQKAELIALIQALQMAKGKAVNIYVDSRYAFATAHVHGVIYRPGKDIKNKEEILSLLEAVYLPKNMAIVHCPGHQRDKTELEKAIGWQIL